MWWTVAKEATTSWSRHKDARQGAALAYYSVFSLGPIIVIAIVIAGLFFGNDAVTSQVTSALKDMLGETGAKAVESMLAGASRPAEGALATILGIGALLFAAIGVVVQLKDALNMVWEVEESDESGLWHFARNYVLSFAAVLALGFLLLVSLLVTAALAAAGKFVAPYMPEGVLHIVSLLVSFAVVAVLFAMMFKWLPDISVGWRDVWLGLGVVGCFELGHEQRKRPYLSGLTADLDIVADPERSEDEQHDAGGEIGQRSLQGETDGKRGGAQHRDQARGLNSEELQDGDADHGEDGVACQAGDEGRD
jgi:membrane protein